MKVCEDEEDALDEESIFSLPCSSASDENCVCCLSKESAEIESVLEVDILCSPVSKNPRYEKPFLTHMMMMRYFFLDWILKGNLCLVMKNIFLLLDISYLLACHSRLLLYLIIMETVMKMLRCFLS
jgi:hypothetical protein